MFSVEGKYLSLRESSYDFVDDAGKRVQGVTYTIRLLVNDETVDLRLSELEYKSLVGKLEVGMDVRVSVRPPGRNTRLYFGGTFDVVEG